MPPGMLWELDCAALANVWLVQLLRACGRHQLSVFFFFFCSTVFLFQCRSKPTLQFEGMSCSSLIVLSKAMGMPGHKLTLPISGLGCYCLLRSRIFLWNVYVTMLLTS